MGTDAPVVDVRFAVTVIGTPRRWHHATISATSAVDFGRNSISADPRRLLASRR
jgi:hypothetical protein